MNRIPSILTIVAASALLVATSPAAADHHGDHGKKSSTCSVSAKKDGKKTAKVTAKQTVLETAVSAGQFNTLVSAVRATELDEVLAGDGPFTVFAPTDEAFAKLPEGTLTALLANPDQLREILLYHVVAGKSVKAEKAVKLDSAPTALGRDLALRFDGTTLFINDARVTTADVLASDGVIHVIDTVLIPPTDTAMATDAPGTIVDVAAGAGTFETLIAAAKAAGLADTLAGDGPYTVFAPTDAAFAKLPEGTVEQLIANPEQLRAVLLYHVVPGRLTADKVLAQHDLKAADGNRLPLEKTSNGARIAGAKISAIDIEASNGVIHVIDSVMLPPKHTN